MTPAELQKLIDASGFSARQFATSVLGRDERTIRRWLSGEIAIPDAAATFLRRFDSVKERRDGSILILIKPE